MGYKKPKIKAGWEMPHGNTHFSPKDGAKAATKVYEKNAVKFGQIAEELGTDVEHLKRVFEAEFIRRQKKSAGQNPFDTIRDILQTRAFTTKEEMAYANLREIMTHGNTWLKFLSKAGIVADDYDDTLWEYDEEEGTFIYDGYVEVSWGGGYYLDGMTIAFVGEDAEN